MKIEDGNLIVSTHVTAKELFDLGRSMGADVGCKLADESTINSLTAATNSILENMHVFSDFDPLTIKLIVKEVLLQYLHNQTQFEKHVTILPTEPEYDSYFSDCDDDDEYCDPDWEYDEYLLEGYDE